VKISGFQYLVKVGDVLTVPRLDSTPGDVVRFNDVLMVKTKEGAVIGKPIVSNAYVEGNVVEHYRGDKVTVFKFIRRENYRRKKGHRQLFTRVKITGINKDKGQ